MKPRDTLRIAQTAPGVTTLGPFTRYGIWVQGCLRRCPGCASPEMQPLEGGYEISIGALSERIIAEKDIEGITISGGEPFLQDEALSALVDMLRKRADLGVIVYTGCALDEVIRSPLLQRCDALIDGAYVRALDDGGSLRGSSNQRLWRVTDRYSTSLRFGFPEREVQLLRTEEGGIAMVGVPSEQDRRLTRRLREMAAGLTGKEGDA